MQGAQLAEKFKQGGFPPCFLILLTLQEAQSES